MEEGITMIVAISWREWLEDLRIERHCSSSSAHFDVSVMPEERTAYVVDTDASDGWREVGTYCTKNLTQLHNALLDDGEPKDYRTVRHDDALRRVADRITQIARHKEVVMSKRHETEFENPDDAANAAPAEPFVFKPVTLGEFSQVRDGTKLADIVRYAARGGMTYAEIGEHIGLDRNATANRMRVGLGKDHGIGHVADENDVVTLLHSPGKTLDDLIKTKAEKPVRQPKPLVVGREFVPVRAGSQLAKIVEFAGDTHVRTDDLASHLGIDAKKVTAMLRGSLAKAHGVGHEVDEIGRVRLLPPEGRTHADLIRTKAEPRPKRTNGAVHPRVSGNAVVTVIVEKNPKRPATKAFADFEKYRTGMTVDEVVAAGVSRSDLSWNRSHGFIRLDEVATE
jgi:hypothetical protein